MSGRAGNQVNNLRALFEPNSNSASPSSRDRSPAGLEGVKGNESGPVSKVRTSFIAVDRIGPMAPATGSKKGNDSEISKLEPSGGDELSAVTNGTVDESPLLNGEKTVLQSTSKDDAEKIDEGKNSDQAKSAEAPSPDKPATPSKNANTSKVVSNAETSSDKLNNTAISGSADNMEDPNRANQPQGLGDILKGAPFEDDVQGNLDASGAQITGAHESESSLPKQKASPKVSLSNGQPKKRSAPKTSSPPKSQSGSSRPPAIDTKNVIPTEPAKTSASSPSNIKKSPRTPGSPDATGHQPPTKPASPRQPVPAKTSNNVGKEIRKASIPKQPQTATGAKAPTVPAPKTRSGDSQTSSQVKKSSRSSPPPKIRPKSPTRPVRLPAGATAATASSTAKTGEAPPPRPPSRTVVAAGVKTSASNRAQPSGNPREGVTTTNSSLRKSSSRPSLPAAGNPTQKAKARTSMASVKAPEGSFLARMMRPTQSSASKVHEKIEHATVPGKSKSSKPRRKSGGSDEQEPEPESNEAPSPSVAQQPDEEQIPQPDSTEEPEREPVDETAAEAKPAAVVEG